MDDVVARLAATAPTRRDEPQAYCKARIRQGYEAAEARTAEAVAAARRKEWGYSECYPLDACVWWRESTQEWVLEIEGTIGDTSLGVRHTQPKDTPPADVPGLPTRYDASEEIAAARREALEQAAAWHDEQAAFYAERLRRTPPESVAGVIFAQWRAISVATATAIRAMKDEQP